MTIAAIHHHAVLPEAVPTVAIAGMVVAAVALWVGLHPLKRRLRPMPLRLGLFALRVGVGFAALMAAAQLALRGLLLATNWEIWPLALLGSAVVEILIALYALERRTVSRRAGLTLAGLRVLLALLVLSMLAQPVLSWQFVEEIQRYVAVLVDESASMRLRDPQRTAAEKLRLAQMLSVGAAQRRCRFEQIVQGLEAARGELVVLSEDLGLLVGAKQELRQRSLQTRRGDLHKGLADVHKSVDRELTALAEAVARETDLDDRTRGSLRDAKAELTVNVRDRLADAVALTAGDKADELPKQYDRLVEAVRKPAAALAKVIPALADVGQTLDERLYASLKPAERAEVDAVAGQTRLELARAVLTHHPVTDFQKNTTGASLLERLSKDYKVRLFTFAGDCVEADPTTWKPIRPPTTAPASAPSTAPAEGQVVIVDQQRTDLAAALRKVMAEMSGKQLAGVVALTDGRHNAAGAVEPLAGQLGLQKVPVCSIVMGPEIPPRDAAVVALHAPETVCERDKLYVDAELKLDGLAGQTVQVALYDDKRQTDQKTIRIPNKVHSHRTRVQFSDEPQTTGLHAYRVEIKPLDGEVFSSNNTYPLTVSVTSERTKLLLLERRPRWEFRYIKNLFADRDRTVKLQYVLLEPDEIASWKNRMKVPASASREVGHVEATELPASLKEWMKFDVIVLGDLSPKFLTPEQADMLQKFVTRRGGTLIVIAGPEFMPHGFANTPLAEILPMTFQPSDKPIVGEQKEGYRIALTAAGRQSVILRQKVDPEENLAVWNSLPEIFWRHPTLAAKEGTEVLAYALPPSAPEFLQPLPPEKVEDEQYLRQREARRREFERSNALIAVHNVADGRVMMLSFDRTWRLRYRMGDTYHHKFWGQVLRWATAGKLPAGTEFVKLGTDRMRYEPGTVVRVRAKIVQPDLAPVVSDNVAVKVFAAGDGEKLVLRRKLQYVPDSPGLYQADIGSLPSGTYRVELQSPDAEPLLAADKVKKVVTEFSVDPVGGPELVELSADRAMPRRLASLSGGVVLDPHQAGQVAASLGPKSLVRREPHELRLWDSWPLLVLILIVATIEWVLRKRVGLA